MRMKAQQVSVGGTEAEGRLDDGKSSVLEFYYYYYHSNKLKRERRYEIRLLATGFRNGTKKILP
jgi:hypothetical protein